MRVLAAVLAASTLTSCGGSILESAEERDRRREKREAVLRQTEKGYKPASAQENRLPDKKQFGEASSGSTVGGKAAGTQQVDAPKDDTVRSGPPPAPGTKSTDSEAAVSCADDMTDELDSSGEAPTYADLQRGCAREAGQQVVLEATTVGALPARMPDRSTHLAITFAIQRRTGSTIYVTAEATDRGWTASVSHGRRQIDLPAPEVTGTLVRLTLPSAEVGSAPVQWRYESSWLQSTLTSTAYAFDDAPNGGGSTTFDRS